MPATSIDAMEAPRLLDGQGAVHHEVFTEAPLRADALASGHAPSGELNEKTRGESSGMNAVLWAREIFRPCDGFACGREPRAAAFAQFSVVFRASRLSTAAEPKRGPVRPLRSAAGGGHGCSEGDRCGRHVVAVGFVEGRRGFEIGLMPVDPPGQEPCSTSCRKGQRAFLRARTTGLHTATAWPSRCQSVIHDLLDGASPLHAHTLGSEASQHGPTKVGGNLGSRPSPPWNAGCGSLFWSMEMAGDRPSIPSHRLHLADELACVGGKHSTCRR